MSAKQRGFVAVEEDLLQRVGYVTIYVGVFVAVAFALMGFAVSLEWFIGRMME